MLSSDILRKQKQGEVKMSLFWWLKVYRGLTEMTVGSPRMRNDKVHDHLLVLA